MQPDKITKEEIKDLIINKNLNITEVIDVVIELNGFIGIGLITLGDQLKDYCYSKIKRSYYE